MWSDPRPPARGELFIVSAPSGAGKTTLIQYLMERGAGRSGGIAFSVSHTTRRPRAGEVDGREYHFVDAATFRSMVAADRFLEWAEVHGHLYGTALDEVMPRLEQGLDVLLDIDVQGAEQVLRRHSEAVAIFVLPPSYEVLRQRLSQRALDDPREVSRRLRVSLWEIKHYQQYEYVIINRDAERAGEALSAIILSRRHRSERARATVEQVVAAFEEAFRSDGHESL